MKWMKTWIAEHPNLWEFILFNILSNVATVVNFIVMWICTGFVFATWKQVPFQFLIFHYTNVESDLELCGQIHAFCYIYSSVRIKLLTYGRSPESTSS